MECLTVMSRSLHRVVRRDLCACGRDGAAPR